MMFGNMFTLPRQIRAIFNRNIIMSSYILLGAFIGICITLMLEYEVKVFSFDGFYETFNFLMITFTTVGYGKFYVP